MATEYEKLIAQGVPPEVAAQTIYNNLSQTSKHQIVVHARPGQVPAVPTEVPQPIPQAPKPKVVMAQEPDPEQPARPGRPISPLSRQRMLASVVLAQAYSAENNIKYLTLDQINECLAEAYIRANAKPKFPTFNTVQNVLSRLRRGEIEGFPPVKTEGPRSQHWGGKVQQIVRIYARDKHQDIKSRKVDLTLIPAWVIQ